MKLKRLLKFLAPFSLLIIAIIFILNLVTHGTIEHPGKVFYKARCAECHGESGEGIRSLVPPLNHSDFAMHNFDSLACWMKYGMSHPIVVNDTLYDQPMYPNVIDEIQTANVINFMSAEFFGMDTAINSAWVKQQWAKCK